MYNLHVCLSNLLYVTCPSHLSLTVLVIAAVCELALDSGVECGEYVQRWHYNPALAACAPFWFGGCGGNANRFTSEHDCLSTCGPRKSRLNLIINQI